MGLWAVGSGQTVAWPWQGAADRAASVGWCPGEGPSTPDLKSCGQASKQCTALCPENPSEGVGMSAKLRCFSHSAGGRLNSCPKK